MASRIDRAMTGKRGRVREEEKREGARSQEQRIKRTKRREREKPREEREPREGVVEMVDYMGKKH